MITTIELASIVYKIVKNSGVTAVTGGGVYLRNRPLNASKDDIVIGNLSVANVELQKSTALINIYAKDVFDGKNHIPNLKKLKDATEFLLPLFRDRWLEEHKTWIDIEYQTDYEVQGVQEWVSVIRLKTRTINE